MNFIKKVFDKSIDMQTHIQFQKFSKGEFKNRAIINAKKTKDIYSIVTSAEFANELVKEVAKKLGEGKTNVVGAIVSTSDLTGKIDFKEKKQFQGVKRYLIEKEMSGDEIVGLVEEFPRTFFALSFDSGNTSLKIKPKAPKSGKPGKGDEEPKADFCRLKTDNKELGESFVFEKPDFKKAIINHTFVIEQIVIPEELKSEKDFSKVREESLRKGKIIRKATIDEKEMNQEFDLEA